MADLREHWGSRIGFILAAAGSAVGLGNLWKFPYITWHNNGGAFVLVYLVCIVIIGLPIMMAEILIGRRTQKSPIPAFEDLGNRGWGLVGIFGALTAFVIMGYYHVIAGWSLSSLWKCLSWSIGGYETSGEGGFGDFLANAPLQVVLAGAFLSATAFIVWRGISRGIERAARLLMPVLLAIMLYLVITVLFMPGIGQTFRFLFTPNFAELPSAGILEALGHAFFTLSLGMGIMITYGSYVHKSESILRSSAMIVFLDTFIALLACVIMYTIIFSMDVDADQGAIGMLFVTLPRLFYAEMPAGVVLGPLFYLLVAFAALTSTISGLEVVVASMMDKLGMSRHRAVLVGAAAMGVCAVFAGLSLGAAGFLSGFEVFGGKPGVLQTLDHLAANWMLPIGGLLTTLFAGWWISKRLSSEELGMTDAGGRTTSCFKLWLFFIRFIAPAAIIAVIVAVVMGKDFS